MHDMTDAQKQRRRNQDAEQRRKVLIERRQEVGEVEGKTEMSTLEHHIMGDAWRKVATREIIAETLISLTQREEERNASIPNREDETAKF